MAMHVNTIKRIIKENTKKPISHRAVVFLTMQTEKWLVDIIKQSDKLLNQQNKLRKERGLLPKKKLDDDVINEAITNGM